MPQAYQIQVVTTMFNRAKYHPYRNNNILEAMKIYARWMKKNKILMNDNKYTNLCFKEAKKLLL